VVLKKDLLGFEKMWMWVLGIVLWQAVAAVRPLYRAMTVRIDKITLAALLFANSGKAGVPWVARPVVRPVVAPYSSFHPKLHSFERGEPPGASGLSMA
jgi:hypothetical protein